MGRLSRLIEEYRKLTRASKRGEEVDLDKLRILEERKTRLMKAIDRFKGKVVRP